MNLSVELRSGSTVGPYTLLRPVGEGASASVFAASDASGREVAIKVRRTGTLRARGLESEMDRRFLREFESMRLLRVKGVVQVHEAGVDGDLLWFSMDLVNGRPFHDAFAKGSVAERVDRVRRLGAELLRILATLHEAGFVHRDIKPTNVLVDDQDQVKVLDFGIGRYFGDQDTLSHTGEVLGTVPYMSPEQLAGLPCDAKVDVFAAGLCLWEAIAGKRQRPAAAVAWIPRICMERLPPLCTLFQEVPRAFSAVVDRLLLVDPIARISAREAATELLAQRADPGGGYAWPEPPFVDPGGGWNRIEGALGNSEHPAIWVVEGPTGSGRSRLAEQVQRIGLLQGVWTLHLRCRVGRVGSPFLELLEHLIRLLDDPVLLRIVGRSAAAIRQTWPHLTLPQAEAKSDAGLTEAVADTVSALARTRPVVLVIRDLEQVDPISARILLALAGRRPKDLGLVLLHEVRWATTESRELVQVLAQGGAGVWSVPRLPPEAASGIARALAPRSTVAVERPTWASGAVAAGWSALARWRGELHLSPDPRLVPLVALDTPLHPAVFRHLLGEPDSHPAVLVGDAGIVPDGATVRAALLAQLADRRKTAALVATAMEEQLGGRAEISGELATAWLLAQDQARAWAPAARAAVYEEQFERYAAAREWLLLLDTLPPSTRRDPHDDFELAWVQARVALYTDSDDSGERMFLLVERLARTDDQEARVRLLRAEFDLRAGHAKGALVTALRIGSASANRPLLQIHALLVAFRCRVVVRQIPEAQRDLERAEALLGEHPHPVLEVRVSNARAELALLQEDLLWCRALCQKNIRIASQTRHLHALAEASFRLGLVLRMLGRRREAEHQIRTAADAALSTGDMGIRANAGLALATLLVERGEAPPARVILDETIRRIRSLSLRHLLAPAMRLALQIATLTGNATDGNVALASLDEAPTTDPETAAALVHWWRTRGDLDRALQVPPPKDTGPRAYGTVLYEVERARTAMAAGDDRRAAELAERVIERASGLGFAELEIYARLLLGVSGAVDEATWTGLKERAVGSMWSEVFLGALEMDARRLQRQAPALAPGRWRALLVRARELGHRPSVEEAQGWLAGAEP